MCIYNKGLTRKRQRHSYKVLIEGSQVEELLTMTLGWFLGKSTEDDAVPGQAVGRKGTPISRPGETRRNVCRSPGEGCLQKLWFPYRNTANLQWRGHQTYFASVL